MHVTGCIEPAAAERLTAAICCFRGFFSHEKAVRV